MTPTDAECDLVDKGWKDYKSKDTAWAKLALVDRIAEYREGITMPRDKGPEPETPGQEREEMLSVLRDVDNLLQGVLSGWPKGRDPDKINFVWKRVKAILYR